MEVQIAVAKVQKYAVSSSGDTVEVVERPQGGHVGRHGGWAEFRTWGEIRFYDGGP